MRKKLGKSWQCVRKKNRELEELEKKKNQELLISETRKNLQIREVEERKRMELIEMEKRKTEEYRALEQAKNREIEKYKQGNIENLKKDAEKLRSLLQQAAINELRTKIVQIPSESLVDEQLHTHYKSLQVLLHEWQQTALLHAPSSYLDTLLQRHKTDLNRIQEFQETKKQENRICIVCWERERSVACVPCGHVIYCGVCAGVMLRVPCAVCRKNVTQLIRIFLT